MTTLTKSISKADPYLDLILNVHPLRPIRNKTEHKRALDALDRLIGDKREVARSFKKVLTSIVESYEREAGFQLDTSDTSPADVVRFLLAERNMSVNAFAKDRGISQSALSDMLNGKRDWSKSVIVTVADYFKLNRGLFLK